MLDIWQTWLCRIVAVSFSYLFSSKVLFHKLLLYAQTSLVAQTVKRLSTMRETQVWSLGWEDPLEKEMAIHSSSIAWKIPWTEELGRLQSMGLERVGHDWATSIHLTSPLYAEPHYIKYQNFSGWSASGGLGGLLGKPSSFHPHCEGSGDVLTVREGHVNVAANLI